MSIGGRTLTIEGHTIPLDPRIASAWAVDEVRSMPRALQVWFAVLLAVMAVAAVAALLALPPGWEVFGTTPIFEWGLLIMGYVFFAIMTSGLCLASSLGTVFGIDRFRPLEKRHAILAVLCLTTAFGVIALDLHYPIRMVFGAILSPAPTSPMWWMGVFYGGYLAVLLVEVWSMFWDHPRIHQWACTGAACMAIIAPATLGAVFAVLVARPFWNNIFTPFYMVASALLLGTSLLGLVFFAVSRFRLAGWERAERLAIPSIRLLLGIALVLVALLVARHMAAGMASTVPGAREGTEAIMFGPMAWQFWGIRVLAGLVVPFVLILWPRTRTPAGLFAASGLIMIGVLSDRILFVTGGQIAPITSGSGNVPSPYSAYTPSLVEIAIIAGAAAFIAFIYTLAERYLDLSEADVHFGFAFPWTRQHEHVPGPGAEEAPPAAVATLPVGADR